MASSAASPPLPPSPTPPTSIPLPSNLQAPPVDDALLSPRTNPIPSFTSFTTPPDSSKPRKSRSVAFHPSTDTSPSSSRYGSPDAVRKQKPVDNRVNIGHIDERDTETDDEGHSGADERTAMFGGRSTSGTGTGREMGYGTSTTVSGQPTGEGKDHVVQRKPSARTRLRDQMDGSIGNTAGAHEDEDAAPALVGWWRQFLDKYGSVELENKGSVARDHLALERTFLAWLRTSLSFASIGIAITQLFRLNVSINPGSPTDAQLRLRHIGKPLGATFLAVGIVTLLIGAHRYFESQHYVILGKFPASRGSIIIIAGLSGALIVASFVTILVIGNITKTAT